MFFVLISFFIVGCGGPLQMGNPLGNPVAFQIRKADGEVVWRKNAVLLLGSERLDIMIESPNIQKVLKPEEPSLSHIPLNLAAMRVSSFGKWKTTDGSMFILASSVSYVKAQDVFLLTDPILSTLDGKGSIRLIASLKNGEQITVDVPNGTSIKNHSQIGIDGSVKQ